MQLEAGDDDDCVSLLSRRARHAHDMAWMLGPSPTVIVRIMLVRACQKSNKDPRDQRPDIGQWGGRSSAMTCLPLPRNRTRGATHDTDHFCRSHGSGKHRSDGKFLCSCAVADFSTLTPHQSQHMHS